MTMTNKDIFDIALRQSAVDCFCSPDDFLIEENLVFISKESDNARKYLNLPHICNFVSYGGNVVASAGGKYIDIVSDFLKSLENNFRLFETPMVYKVNELFEPFDARVCFMAEFFLPDIDTVYSINKTCGYETRILDHVDFAPLYLPQWSEALCENRKELDVLGVGAYDNGELIGLAACSADCEDMWQIGIDVLPDYRRRGIASALTLELTREILSRDKVPFYCSAWSNIKSVKNAISCGFKPAWTELTVKKNEYIKTL